MSQHSLSIDLLSDGSLQLLSSSITGANPHANRKGLLEQITSWLKENSWPTFTQSTFHQLPVALFGFSVVQHGDGNLYVYGGRASSDTNITIDSHFYCFSQKQQKWREVTQYHLPQPRRWHTAVVHGDSMYVYGGQAWNQTTAEWDPCGIIDRFEFSSNTWSVSEQHGCPPSTKTKRCATAVDGNLYVLPAGQLSSPTYTMLHSFDLDSCCWNMQSCTGNEVPDSQQLVLEQLVHHQGSLLAVFSSNPAAAGHNIQQDHQQTPEHQGNSRHRLNQSELSIYSLCLTTRKWSKLVTEGEAPASRTQSCITLLDELLIVSGGTRGAETPLLADLAFLHIPSCKWHQLQLPAACQPARACHAAAIVRDGKVYLMGGWHEGWPAPAPGLVLQRKYIRSQQKHDGGLAAVVDQDSNSSSTSRPVINTELRAALLKAASRATAAAVPMCSNDCSSSFNRSMPYCDVTLTSGEGLQFPAHRVILASQSPVLEAMLGSSNMSEAATGIASLPDVSSAVLEALLSYLYGGLPAGIPQELVLELFTAADKFMLPGLAAECVLILLGCLTSDNVSLVADLANTHRLTELWEACVVFAAAPGVQLNVFNSAAYAQLWQDSAFVAQTFTTQVVALTQQAMTRLAQQMPARSTLTQDMTRQVCQLPQLQHASTGTSASLELPNKRQRMD